MMNKRSSKPLSALPVGRTILFTLIALAAISGLILEFTILRGYASHWWNHVPAFYLLYGGVAGGVLILLTTALGKALVHPTELEETSETPL